MIGMSDLGWLLSAYEETIVTRERAWYASDAYEV